MRLFAIKIQARGHTFCVQVEAADTIDATRQALKQNPAANTAKFIRELTRQ